MVHTIYGCAVKLTNTGKYKVSAYGYSGDYLFYLPLLGTYSYPEFPRSPTQRVHLF